MGAVAERHEGQYRAEDAIFANKQPRSTQVVLIEGVATCTCIVRTEMLLRRHLAGISRVCLRLHSQTSLSSVSPTPDHFTDMYLSRVVRAACSIRRPANYRLVYTICTAYLRQVLWP